MQKATTEQRNWARYDRELRKYYRARAALAESQERMVKLALIMAPIGKVSDTIRIRYENAVYDLVYGDGMGPEYDDLFALTVHLKSKVIPELTD
jgi:hypothetical protein